MTYYAQQVSAVMEKTGCSIIQAKEALAISKGSIPLAVADIKNKNNKSKKSLVK